MRVSPSFQIQSPSWSALPASRSGKSVVLAGADDTLRAYSDETSQLLWQRPLGSEPEQLFAGDRYLVSKNRDSLVTVDGLEGKTLWSKDGGDKVLATSGSVVVTEDRDRVQAFSLTAGEPVWSASKKGPTAQELDTVFVVTPQEPGVESLEAREIDSGAVRWRLTDGDIQHVQATEHGVFYSAVKIGKHKEPVTHVSGRELSGEHRWGYTCPGPLREPPILSADGARLALKMVNPVNRSVSFVSVLDARTGEELFQDDAALDFDVAFLNDGSVLLGETEFSEVPDQGTTRHRLLNRKGVELWRKPGRPSWMMGGESPVVQLEGRLVRLDVESGEEVWASQLGGATPISADPERLAVLVDGCRMMSVDLKGGAVLESVSSGDQLLINPEEPGLLTDHEGRVWTASLPEGGAELFAGEWERPRPFHIPFLMGPARRGEQEAVFVDWDGDEADGGDDPILIDSHHSVLSMEQLKARDQDADGRLATAQLEDLSLWFDLDSNGEVTSSRELTPLIDSASFDKARVEFEQERLWLASGSRCSGHG